MFARQMRAACQMDWLLYFFAGARYNSGCGPQLWND
jgi:hypothetical protein